MTGERSGVRVFNQTIILQVKSATNVSLDWKNIDKITFTTFGGTNAMINGGDGTHFAMDNLCITTDPQEQQELLYKCDYWGDPQLIQFPKAVGSIASSTWCQITGSSILYQSSYVLLNVVNSGSQRGDIVTSFEMTLYNADKIQLCTLTPSDVIGTPQSCGPDVSISKMGSNLNVAYRKAPFAAWIRYSSWGGGHYKFTLFATLTHINQNSSTGICINGCTGRRNAPQLIITNSTTHKEVVISEMADTVCDTFINQATQQLPQNNLSVETTPGYLAAVKQACIIDVTVTGSTQFAEQSVSNVITDVLTHSGEIDIDQINNVIQNITQIAQQTNNEAEILVETMVEESTLPCRPGVIGCNGCSKRNGYFTVSIISLLAFVCSNFILLP
ncbi:unnamed protein product [Rotaria sp. Silwood2]|nr:unnamed protein product [Rotaria sp. Silwood2]